MLVWTDAGWTENICIGVMCEKFVICRDNTHMTMKEADVKRQRLRLQGQNQSQNSVNLELMTRRKRHREGRMKNWAGVYERLLLLEEMRLSVAG